MQILNPKSQIPNQQIQLVIPLDLHVGRVARQLGLLNRTINDWQAAKELTMELKK
jgi:hypothetical protein